MKISKKIFKNLIVQQIIGFVAAIYIYFVGLTSNIKYINISIPKLFWDKKQPFILAFWHNQLMMVSYAWKSKKKINIIASTHSDGRFGSIVGKYFSLNNIPSSFKKNDKAIKIILSKIKENEYVGITPDGPRGPKENVSEGIIRIARATNTPIITCGFWSSKNFNLNSWDSFLITLPFSSCCFVWQKPLYIPKDLDNAEIKEYQNVLKNLINDSINIAKKNL